MVKEYYRLAKPGMVYGNVITTIASFLFALAFDFSQPLHTFVLFIATTLGISLIIGSACVYNNIADREIDKKMERTKNRALVTGRISIPSALLYGALLGSIGFSLLYVCVNPLTAYIGAFGWFSYVVLYGLAKRGSSLGALVGSISGGVPIIVGYTAVTNSFDTRALLLFIILALWQMPHFYAIAIYRLEDYKKAGIPVLPAEKGMLKTKLDILIYLNLYILVTLSFSLLGYAGVVYFLSSFIFGILWLVRSLRGFTAQDDTLWAKSLFKFSLIVLLAFCTTLALSPLLP